ncbi:MAG: hypothetical protein M2R45_03341 [Verrucomicrobia subdivision 3 bacterium]|nr:hypothetical protein [Limisphaerales bacterium]MCS1415377.1 hypothetical protein [Limisphaerales bacterium]
MADSPDRVITHLLMKLPFTIRPTATLRSALPAGILSMCDADHNDEKHSVNNFIDNMIAVDPDSVGLVGAFQFLNTLWTRTIGEEFQRGENFKQPKPTWIPKIFLLRTGELNSVGAISNQPFLDLFQRHSQLVTLSAMAGKSTTSPIRDSYPSTGSHLGNLIAVFIGKKLTTHYRSMCMVV